MVIKNIFYVQKLDWRLNKNKYSVYNVISVFLDVPISTSRIDGPLSIPYRFLHPISQCWTSYLIILILYNILVTLYNTQRSTSFYFDKTSKKISKFLLYYNSITSLLSICQKYGVDYTDNPQYQCYNIFSLRHIFFIKIVYKKAKKVLI